MKKPSKIPCWAFLSLAVQGLLRLTWFFLSFVTFYDEIVQSGVFALAQIELTQFDALTMFVSLRAVLKYALHKTWVGMKNAIWMAGLCLMLTACGAQTVEQVVDDLQTQKIKDGDAIVVTGTVATVALQPEPFVLLQGSDKSNALYALLSVEQAKSVQVGQKISVDCRAVHHQANGKGVLVTSRNCVLK